jgi:Cu(I)-responsive transcriptional regulator
MKAGLLSKKADINIETLRYYESIGLLPKPKRLDSGYRIYSETDLKQLLFIKHAKILGFSLKEIKELLYLKVDKERNCTDVRQIAEKKISEIDFKLKEMEKIKKALTKLAEKCRNKNAEECPILNEIENVE